MSGSHTPDEVKHQLDQFRPGHFERFGAKSARSSSARTRSSRGPHGPDRRRPRAARRRAGAGQDAAGAHPCGRAHLKFQRIQFTPDLMPADLIGTNVVLETPEGGAGSSSSPGPCSPTSCWPTKSTAPPPRPSRRCSRRCRSSRHRRGHDAHPLPPFFVLATQNPLEMEGTYPLPEAQLDRFFFKLLVKFPTADEIEPILDRTTEAADAVGRAGLRRRADRRAVAAGPADPDRRRLRRYAIALVLATHPETSSPPSDQRYVRYGSSPRGAQAIILAAKIRAILDHRYHVAATTSAPPPTRPAAPPDPQLRRPGRGHPGRRHHRRHSRIDRGHRALAV